MSLRVSVIRSVRRTRFALEAAINRLDKSFSPRDTLNRLKKHEFVLSDSVYVFQIVLAAFWITIMKSPGFPLKLIIPIMYTILLLIPFTSQFFFPATPIFSWVLCYFCSRFIPNEYRPTVSVVTLPTLESALYGANVSDILTHFTHPILDIMAWIPYGVAHFALPFFVAAFLWLFRQTQALQLWSSTFGFMNLIGVLVQIVYPCSAPWYEVIHGLTPARYEMLGSPGGLHRIDDLFHSSGYTMGFSHSPVIFGAFPSLHAANATIAALFLSHFFPQTTKYIWAYAGVLYWATMYLTHHYLIDVVGGACLATAIFYFMLTDEFRGANATAPPNGLHRLSKYDLYDLDDPRRANGNGRRVANGDYDMASELSGVESEEEVVDIAYRSPLGFGRPQQPQQQQQLVTGQKQGGKNSHRHTASIASLIRSDDRAEDGWSPIGSAFSFPATSRTERTMEEGRMNNRGSSAHGVV